MTFTLTSPTFSNNGDIAADYTCDGADHFPGLEWQGAPEGTKSFVLICDDPDVPEELRAHVPDLVWDHLVVFNIPTVAREIAKGPFQCPEGAICATNSWGRQDYGGPCPPNPKPHRYFFTLYALDALLTLSASATKKEVLAALDGHVLDKAQLVGTYLRAQFRS